MVWAKTNRKICLVFKLLWRQSRSSDNDEIVIGGQQRGGIGEWMENLAEYFEEKIEMEKQNSRSKYKINQTTNLRIRIGKII